LGEVINVFAGDSLDEGEKVGHRAVATAPLGGPGARSAVKKSLSGIVQNSSSSAVWRA
jgi:hypothetical protein